MSGGFRFRDLEGSPSFNTVRAFFADAAVGGISQTNDCVNAAEETPKWKIVDLLQAWGANTFVQHPIKISEKDSSLLVFLAFQQFGNRGIRVFILAHRDSWQEQGGGARISAKGPRRMEEDGEQWRAPGQLRCRSDSQVGQAKQH